MRATRAVVTFFVAMTLSGILGFTAVSYAVEPPSTCVGDCSGNGAVSVNELVLLVNIALGADVSACPAGDGDVDHQITINEIVDAVSNALSGCHGPVKAPAEMSTTELVAEITGGTPLARSAAATHEALARGGVAVADQTTTFLPAVPPASSATVLASEALNLALEARNRSAMWTLTATQLGKMLADFGWPFSADSPPGTQLVALLQLWTAAASTEPGDPLSFAPLFIAEMAKQQTPPVDLTTGTANPDDVRLSLLELQLFGAAFDRLVTAALGSERWTVPSSVRAVHQHPAALSVASQPCSEARAVIGKAFGPVGDYVWGEISRRSGKRFVGDMLQAAGVSADSVADFRKSLSALSIATRVWKLVALYSNIQVAVKLDGPNPRHKPLSEKSIASFTARAGVSDAEWQEYVDKFGEWVLSTDVAVRDCLNEFGIPTFADMAQIAADAANWDVKWRLRKGSPQHAVISSANTFEYAMTLRNSLMRTSPTSAETTLFVDILPEDFRYHSSLPGKITPVEVCAEVDTSKPPSLRTFVQAANGLQDVLGFADALVELGAGWLQSMAMPSACATLRLGYHDQLVKGWHGVITYTEQIEEAWSGSDTQCHSTAKGTCSRQHDYFYRAEAAIEGSEGAGEAGIAVYNLRGSVSATAMETTTDFRHLVGTFEDECELLAIEQDVTNASITDRLDGGILQIFSGQYMIGFILPTAEGFYDLQGTYDKSGPQGCASHTETSYTNPATLWARGGLPPMTGQASAEDPYHFHGAAAGNDGGISTNVAWDLTYVP